jgi:surface protein
MENGKKNKGKIKYNNNNNFIGNFNYDKEYEGKGYKSYKNGDKYEGELKNGMREGNGILINKNGDKFDCIWKDDKIQIINNYEKKDQIKENELIMLIKKEDLNKEIQIINYNYWNDSVFYYCDQKNQMEKNINIYINDRNYNFIWKVKLSEENYYKIKIKYKNLLEDMSYMFYQCSSYQIINLNDFDTSRVTTMEGLFQKCLNLQYINFNNLQTTYLANMKAIFSECKNLISIDLSTFKTDNVIDMSYMFYGCSNLKEIKGLNNLNTNKVSNMRSMFYECKNIISIDLSNFNTDKVIDMSYMFYGCSNLKKLNIYNFKLNQECNKTDLFEGIDKIRCKLIIKDEKIKNIFYDS